MPRPGTELETLPRGMDSRDSRDVLAQEREERRRWGVPDKDGRIRSMHGVRTRAAFRPLLPDAPRGVVSREAAEIYVAQIQRVLDMDCWTRQEQSYLYSLRKKWRARARGEDTRFILRGCLPPSRGMYTPADCARDIHALLESAMMPKRQSMTERMAKARSRRAF